MTDDNMEFEIELNVIDPLKKEQKDKVIQKINSIFSENSVDVQLKDTFYVEKRGAEILEALHMIFQITSPYATIAGFILGIIFYLKSQKGGHIKIKKSDGTTIHLTSEMSPDEIIKKLDNDE